MSAKSSSPQQTTCRACLVETSEVRSIYKLGKICGQTTKLASMLADCTHLEVKIPKYFNSFPENQKGKKNSN